MKQDLEKYLKDFVQNINDGSKILKEDNDKDDQFGGVGEFFLNHQGETFSGSVDFRHNLYPEYP